MTENELTLEKILNSFEEQLEPYNEYEVHSTLNKLGSGATQKSGEFLAESMAFGFLEDYKDENTGWGTYYGPMMVFPNEQGQLIESPSIKLVTEDMIKFWTERAYQAKHPTMKARYADLVWDFAKKTTGKAGGPDMARFTIDANLEILTKHLYKYESDAITKLNRSLSLALQLNDLDRKEKVKNTIIAFEDFLIKDNNTKLRGFSYDLLIENNRVSLSADEIKKIIADLEVLLDLISDINNQETFDPFESEDIAIRLAKYYRKLKNEEKVRNILLKYGNGFLYNKVDGFVKTNFY